MPTFTEEQVKTMLDEKEKAVTNTLETKYKNIAAKTPALTENISMKSAVKPEKTNEMLLRACALSAFEKTGLDNAFKSLSIERSMLEGIGKKGFTDDFVNNFNNTKTLRLTGYLPIEGKSNSVTDFSGGGAAIEQIYAPDVFELLYALSAFFQAKPDTREMPNGNLTIRKIISGTTGYWRGENTKITQSSVKWGQVKLSSKFLCAGVPLSRKLIRWGHGIVENAITKDISMQMKLAADSTILLTGLGTEYTPNSLYNFSVAASQTNAMTAWSTAADLTTNSETDLTKAYGYIVKNNMGQTGNIVVFMTEFTKFRLSRTTTTTGYPTLLAQEINTKNTIYGCQIITSNLLNASGNATSTVIFAAMDQVVYGTSLNMEIRFEEFYNYYDAAGNVVLGNQTDESGITASLECDVNLAQSVDKDTTPTISKAISSITAVTWGA